MKSSFKKYFPIFSSFVIVLLIGLFVFRFFYSKPYFLASVISQDLVKITKALDKIDQDCSILNIAGDNVEIDFLTVVKFVGSEVGGINLAYPDKWQGPYLKDDPVLYGIFYQIVKTKEGFFIIPGVGAKLPNGLVVGKDFKLDKDSLVSKMLLKDGQLNYKGIPLGTKLEFKIGDWNRRVFSDQQIEKINAALKEFNEAMPFTFNYETRGDACYA